MRRPSSKPLDFPANLNGSLEEKEEKGGLIEKILSERCNHSGITEKSK
jgi:hypothetical protein